MKGPAVQVQVRASNRSIGGFTPLAAKGMCVLPQTTLEGDQHTAWIVDLATMGHVLESSSDLIRYARRGSTVPAYCTDIPSGYKSYEQESCGFQSARTKVAE